MPTATYRVTAYSLLSEYHAISAYIPYVAYHMPVPVLDALLL